MSNNPSASGGAPLDYTLDELSDGSSVTQESGSDDRMNGPPVIEEYISQHTLVGSGHIIPIDAHGDFIIRLITTGRVEDDVDAAFRVRRDTIAHRCPALVDGAEGNTMFLNAPSITLDFEEGMEKILVNLHADTPKTCMSTTCPSPEECLGAYCDGILPIRVWYWIARLKWELGITLRGITEELLLEWAEFQLPGVYSTDMIQFKDWYLLGPIAHYMGSDELARCVTYVIQNQCIVLGPPESEMSVWVLRQEDGLVVYFGKEDDWPCYDPVLDMLLSPWQRLCSSMKRGAFVSALENTLVKLKHMGPPGGPGRTISPGTLDLWREYGAKGCLRCKYIPWLGYVSRLREVGVEVGSDSRIPAYHNLSLIDMVSKVTEVHRNRFDNDYGVPVGMTEPDCCVFRHLMVMGDRLKLMIAPTPEQVRHLLYYV